jgi:hypothetical protein
LVKQNPVEMSFSHQTNTIFASGNRFSVQLAKACASVTTTSEIIGLVFLSSNFRTDLIDRTIHRCNRSRALRTLEWNSGYEGERDPPGGVATLLTPYELTFSTVLTKSQSRKRCGIRDAE